MPGLMWWPGHIPAGAHYDEMMSHVDAWSTLAAMAGITPPPHGEWQDNNNKPIYFDSVDNSAYILGTAQHSARNSWVYIDGETFQGVRADIGGDPNEPWVHGSTSTRPKIHGLARRRIWEPSARSTI